MTNQEFRVRGMDCANCARELETGVAQLPGVRSVSVDFATEKMSVDGEVSLPDLERRVEALGKRIESDDGAPYVPKRGGVRGFWEYLLERRPTQLALLGGAGVLLTFLLSRLLTLSPLVEAALYTVSLLVTLVPIARSGLTTLWINREFNINLLMSVAAVGALAIGEYLEGATVIFLFAIGEALEGYTADRARDSLRSLVALKPQRAILLNGTLESVVPVADLRVGDQILVKPGAAIPMDGEVLTGGSGVNQSPITGESVPVPKSAGDEVYAGTLNGEGTLTVRVTRSAKDNTLSRIIQLVEEAQSVRAPSQRMIDRFARYYTPAVVLMALLVATLPPLLLGQPFWDSGATHGWLYRALAMLVIACPCALVISTPVTVISAITAAARRGVLIKGGAHLEALGKIRAVAFDKTGTLTEGRPEVLGYRSLICESGEDCEHCDDLLALAAAVERRTTHPLADAVVGAASRRAVRDSYAPADNVELLAGRGVRGTVDNRAVTIGSHALFDADYPHSEGLCRAMDAAEAAGATMMLLARDETVVGYISLADAPRATSAAVVQALNRLGLPTVMLTGDNESVAQAIGDSVGVSQVRARLLPEDKVSAVRELMERYGSVAMVGDGINDTPAFAAAAVGVAMGGAGTPQAIETADIVLMADDLHQLPFAVRLARFARALIRQNVVLSFGLKAVFLVLAVFGVTSLWLAILADVGMSLVVTLNGMRPLRMR